MKRARVIGLCCTVVVLGLLGASAEAADSFFDVYFEVELPVTEAPPYPSSPKISVTGVKPGPPEIEVEIIELSLVSANPVDLPLRVEAYDSGDPDDPGPDSFFDVFYFPPLPQPDYPPDSFFDIFFELKPPLGEPQPVLTKPVYYDFPAESFFDVFFEVEIPGEGLILHQLHGEVNPAQPLILSGGGDGAETNGTSFFDVFVELNVPGPDTVNPDIPLISMRMTADPIIPEPAGLGLIGLLMMIARRKRGP